MRIIGVDPGSKGAFAVLEDLLLVGVHDMPAVAVSKGDRTRNEVSVYEINRLVKSWAGTPALVVFEQVSSQPKDSAAAAFTFGRNVMAAEAALRVAFRFELVTPAVWKRDMKLTDKEKSDSRALACSLWPDKAHLFARVKDDGRAEAALIAEWGRRKFGGSNGVFD